MSEQQPEAPAKPDGVRIGGLMRCCLETLHGHYPDGPAAKAAEGEVLPCKHCRSSMIFSEGYWEWNQQPEAPAPIDLGYMSLPPEVQHAAEEAAAANRAAREAPAVPGVTRFRKKPVVISAIQWTGANLAEVQAFCGSGYFDAVAPEDRAEDPDITAKVYDKLHSTWVHVYDGQWIICGVQGETYPCAADVFAATYEPAGELLARAAKPCGCGPLQPCAAHMGPGGSDLTPSQCDRLRHMVTEHETALSAVRRGLEMAAAHDAPSLRRIAAAWDGLRVLEGGEEGPGS